MAKLTKKQKALQGKVDRNKLYPVQEALTLVKETRNAKFDESIDVAVNLGVDATKSDQVVRGSVVLPAGTGKTVRVAVFAQGDKAEAAKAAGADSRRFRRSGCRSQGRQPEFRRRHRHAGCHEGRRPAGPDSRSARPDAEPEGRYRDHGCDHGGEERQGRSGSVPYRQGRHRACAPSAAPRSRSTSLREQPEGADRGAEQGQAGLVARVSTCARLQLPPPWVPVFASIRPRLVG